MQNNTKGLNRRSFLKLMGGTVCISTFGCNALTRLPEPKKTKPNIVLIMADDIGYECFGCYGSQMYQTPNIDKLAENGVRFTHCYAQPLCTPTRVKLMTGQSNIRNYIDFSIMDPAEKTFGHMMQAHGYKTCISGKWQLYGTEMYGEAIQGKGTLPADAGFDQWCLWQVKEKGKRYWGPLLEINGKLTQYDKELYGPDICTDFINDFVMKNKDKPFFAYYPMILVHQPMTPTPDSQDKTCRDKQKNFEDMVVYMDKLIGKVIDNLKAAGVLENTLIFFVGDNGTTKGIKSKLGDKVIIGGKSKTTDAGTRVPLVASFGGAPAGIVCDDLVDMSDFMPTIAEATGASLPTDVTLDGRSFLPQILGKKGNPIEARFMYFYPWPNKKYWPAETRFAWDKRWKLYGDGRLYDIHNDVLEEKPILKGQGCPKAEAARKKLQRVIDSMPAEPVKLRWKHLSKKG